MSEKNEVYVVTLSDVNQALYFPQQCVCCGKGAETELHVYYEHSHTLGASVSANRRGYNLPYCKSCARYHLRRSRAVTYGIFAFIALLFGLGITIERSRMDDKLLGLALFLFGNLLAYKAIWHLIIKWRKRENQCCISGNPVNYVWGSKNKMFQNKPYFVFRNQSYASEFARRNNLKAESNIDYDISYS